MRRVSELWPLGSGPPAADTILEVLTTLPARVARIRDKHGTKLIRFGAVSAFNVVFGQVLLFTAQVALGLSPVPANAFSVSIGAFPGYILSRYWVWNKRGKNHIIREVIPFWTLTLLGFVLSTTAVWLVDTRWDPSPVSINLTSLVAFGAVWAAKFVILDRMLFNAEEAAAVS